MLAPGASVPDFTLHDLDGVARSLASFHASKPVLIALFKASCPVCQYTLPFLERLAASDSVNFVAISQDGAETARKFAAEYGVTFPMLIDEADAGYPVSNAFGIRSVPSLFVVETTGTISLAGEGFAKSDLEAIGERAGIAPFEHHEKIPLFRPG